MVAVGEATFGAAVSEHPDPAQAVGEAAGSVLEQVGPGADISLLFVTAAHAPAMADIAAATHSILSPGVLAGTTAISVIGGPTEVENMPAVSVWAGRTGRAEAVRLEVIRSSDGTAVVGMPDDAADGPRTLLLLADPFSFPTEAFVRASNDQYPDLSVVGGVASAGGPGINRLALQGSVHHEGAVGVLLPEAAASSAIVSQGCRPVGDPFIVTASDGTTVLELGSQPAADRLREVLDETPEEDRHRLSGELQVGLVIRESAEYRRGDFLIRGVRGTDPVTGGLRIGASAPVGTTLQFHVRDAATADQDLVEMLGGRRDAAALVFTGNGRGTQLFGTPDHDAVLVSHAVDGGAVAGMFCAGALGPVGGRNHVHGLTASVLLFGR